MKRHTLIMLLCCLIPLAGLAVLWAVGAKQTYLIWGILLLCPLLHVVMTAGMGKDKGEHTH